MQSGSWTSVMQSVVSDVCHSSPSDEDEENEFYDAQDEACSQNTDADFILKIPLGHRRNSSGLSFGSQVGFHCCGYSTDFFIFVHCLCAQKMY
jgi:hypothetical protein